jgi:hypothetical protein
MMTRGHLNALATAFPKVAGKILHSYDGSTLIADSQQDLIGDKYLAEQIKQINEDNRNKSILDKWSHLLYKGEDEKNYTSAFEQPITDRRGFDNDSIVPLHSRSVQTFTLNTLNGKAAY